MAWVSPLLWPFLRTLAVFTSAPVFSGRGFPVRARIGLAFFVALAAQPSLAGMPVVDLNTPAALAMAAQQVVVGLSIGFAVRALFAAIELAGEMAGTQMGLGFASFFDPMLSSQSSAVARFLSQMGVFIFVVVGGHLMVLMAVVHSYTAFPVDERWLAGVASLRLFDMGRVIFASGLWMALPMLGMLLFANLALGVASRVAPQMNVFAIGFPVTLAVGLLGLAMTLPMLDQPIMALIQTAVDWFAP